MGGEHELWQEVSELYEHTTRIIKCACTPRINPCTPLLAVEGDHELWEGVSEPCKHVIRAFLVHFEKELLESLCHSPGSFDFRNGSVGKQRRGHRTRRATF